MLYAAKCYWPGVSPHQLEEVATRAQRAAGRARRARVAFLGSILFPDDELVLCLFDAPTQAVVKQTSEEAGIPCERVMTTVWLAQKEVKVMLKPLVAATVATFALAAVAGTAVPPARAAEPVVVNLLQCDADGGTATVPAGVPVQLHPPGYAQGTYGLIVDFLLKERTTLTIARNGTTSVVDLTGTWSAPQQLDTHFFLTREPNFDLGSLSSGESVAVTWTLTFVQPLLVAYPPVGPTGDNGPFLINGEGPASCVITAG